MRHRIGLIVDTERIVRTIYEDKSGMPIYKNSSHAKGADSLEVTVFKSVEAYEVEDGGHEYEYDTILFRL